MNLPLGVNADQAKFFPATIYDVSDSKVELATHDNGVWFSC
jgi:hypothetical protein